MLPNDVHEFINSDKQTVNEYHKMLLKYHPDRNKNDTTEIYITIKNSYKKEKIYKQIEKDVYKVCNFVDVASNNVKCACGMLYDIRNVYDDIIDCEYCSLRIQVLI
ncbi:hypothetical protein BDAP_002746 [Binucleata daphniae]